MRQEDNSVHLINRGWIPQQLKDTFTINASLPQSNVDVTAVVRNWPQKGKVCVAGSGACQKTGLFLCKLDTSGVECSAKAPNQPSPEKCDDVVVDADLSSS